MLIRTSSPPDRLRQPPHSVSPHTAPSSPSRSSVKGCSLVLRSGTRAIRIVANSKYNAHTEPLFKLFRILKLSDVLILQTMKVYHKFRNKELPVYMQNWPLIINNEIHQYNTRIASDLHTFRYHHTFAKKSLRHYLVQTINNTPDNVFSKFGTHSLNGFSNYVKLNLINNYQDECNIQNCYICSQI